MNFDLRHLRHFVAVYHLRNFNRAAEDQHVTQSAITKSIQTLEDMIGVKLFDRTTRSVSPTTEGEHLLHLAEDLLRQSKDFEREAQLLRSADLGEVTVGSGPYPPDTLIAPAIRRFSKHHPKVSVQVRTGDTDQLIDRLVKHASDFLVCDMSRLEDSPYCDQIAVQALPPEPVVIISARNHPVTKQKLDPDDYFRFPWVTTGSTPHYKRQLQQQNLDNPDAYNRSRYNVESVATCLTLVEDSRVLTLIPRSLALRVCRNRNLVMSPFPLPLVTNDGIHTLKGRTSSAAARVLMEEITGIAREAIDID